MREHVVEHVDESLYFFFTNIQEFHGQGGSCNIEFTGKKRGTNCDRPVLVLTTLDEILLLQQRRY